MATIGPDATTGSVATGGIKLLGDLVTNETARKWLTRAAALAVAVDASKAVYQWGRKRASYTIGLSSRDDLYDDVHAWLLAQLPPQRRRSLTARAARRSSSSDLLPVNPGEDSPEAEKGGGIVVRYDGARIHTVTIGRHRVRVEVEREESRLVVADRDSRDDDLFGRRERLVFTASSAAGRDAVLAFLKGLAEARYTEKANRFFLGTRWGGWDRRPDLGDRPLSTVILRDGLAEDLVKDLERFLGEEPDYRRLGIPWHRGYLFHGPAGTGKTSLAKALAQHFGLDVYYLPVSDVTADTNLLSMFSQVEPRSMLVLEDVDVVHAARERDDAETTQAISAAGLLNALDGLVTPHGLITVLTTNHLEVLDPALIRPGRADRVEELGYLTDDQVARIVRLVCGDDWHAPAVFPMPDLAGHARLTPAELVEAAKAHLGNPGLAYRALRDRVVRANFSS